MSMEIVQRDGRRRFRFGFRPLLVPPSPDALFPAGSVIRRVYSDSAVFGAGRALLLQLAHPSVSRGVYEHSDYAGNPLDRLLGTGFAMANVVHGSRSYVEHLGRVLGDVHSRVVGEGYSALDPELVMWVSATLADTAAGMYQRLVRPLSEEELDEFFADARVVADVFGCPIDLQPTNAAEFRAYWDDAVDRLVVTDTAREIASSLLGGVGLPLRPLWLPPLAVARAMTAATLPPAVRDGFGLAWGAPQRATAELVFGLARPVLSRMPDEWRQLGGRLLRSPEPEAAGRQPGDTATGIAFRTALPDNGSNVAESDSTL